MAQSNDAVTRAKMRKLDLAAIASTPAGKRFFQERLSEARLRGEKFQRNADDAFYHGRRDAVWDLYKELKDALSRELFCEIIYPKSLEDLSCQ